MEKQVCWKIEPISKQISYEKVLDVTFGPFEVDK